MAKGEISPEKIYTASGLAEALGLAERTIRDKASRGEIPSKKVFGRYYFKGSEIIAHINEAGKDKGNPGDWR